MSFAVTLMEQAREFLAKKTIQTAAVAILPLAVAAGTVTASPVLLDYSFPKFPSSGGLFGCDYRYASSQSALNFWALGTVSLAQLQQANEAQMRDVNVNVVDIAESTNVGFQTVTMNVIWWGNIGGGISPDVDTLTMHHDLPLNSFAITNDVVGEPSFPISSQLSLSVLVNSRRYGPVQATSDDLSPTGQRSLGAGTEIGLSAGGEDLARWEVQLSASWDIPSGTDRDKYVVEFILPGSSGEPSPYPNYVEWTGPSVPLPSASGGAVLLMSLLAGFKLGRQQMSK